jgi:hypothetical protein
LYQTTRSVNPPECLWIQELSFLSLSRSLTREWDKTLNGLLIEWFWTWWSGNIYPVVRELVFFHPSWCVMLLCDGPNWKWGAVSTSLLTHVRLKVLAGHFRKFQVSKRHRILYLAPL